MALFLKTNVSSFKIDYLEIIGTIPRLKYRPYNPCKLTNPVKFHEFNTIDFLCLTQRDEANIRWLSGIVAKWTLDRVQVMGANGNEGTLSAQVLMKFILELNEALVVLLGECDVSQNSSNAEFSNSFSLVKKKN